MAKTVVENISCKLFHQVLNTFYACKHHWPLYHHIIPYSVVSNMAEGQKVQGKQNLLVSFS